MNSIKDSLLEIGLTNSEARVYLALSKLGASSKTNIIKEAKISSSKIYYVLEKLIDKGLVSKVIQKGKQYFSACSITRINDYLEEKRKEIEKQKQIVQELSHQLIKMQKQDKTKVEVFFGWKGLETVYSTIIKDAKKEQEVFIMGASKGFNADKTKEFFIKFGRFAFNKNLDIKGIFNEDAKEYVDVIEKEAKIKYNKRFLDIHTPVEISITKNFSVIVMMKENPIVILIEDKETAESFKEYFIELWKSSKTL